jgi:hypothetical protein
MLSQVAHDIQANGQTQDEGETYSQPGLPKQPAQTQLCHDFILTSF